MAENEITIELLQQPEYVIQLNEQGPAGPQGEQGIQGEQGKQGVKGDKGDEGPRGYAGTITVGDVVMEGDQVIIENNGTPEDAILDFTFPNYNASPNAMLLDVDQEVPSHKTFLEDQGIKSPLLDIRTDRSKRGNGLIFIDKNGTQTAGIGPYVNNNGSPECRLIASNGSVSAFAGLGTTKDGQGFFEIPEPSATSDNRDAVTSHWVREFVKSNSTAGHMVGELVPFPVSTKFTPEGFIKPDGTEFTQGLFPDLYREYLTDHRWFDKSKIEVVGTPTITDDGIASGFSSSNYLNTNTNTSILNKYNTWEIKADFETSNDVTSLQNIYAGQTEWSGVNVQIGFEGAGMLGVRIVSTPGNPHIVSFNIKPNTKYNTRCTCDGINYLFYIKEANSDTWTSKVIVSKQEVPTLLEGNIILGVGDIINVPFTGSIDLKQFSISVDGKEVYSPTANTLDTCTYEEYANEVNTCGACAKWAVDDVRKTFKVPFMPAGYYLKNGDGTVNKCGLPNITAEWNSAQYIDGWNNKGGARGAVYGERNNSAENNSASNGVRAYFDASRSNSIYGRTTDTVETNAIAIQWFIYVANAQIGQSAIDWSRFETAVASKAGKDLGDTNNKLANSFLDKLMPDYSAGVDKGLEFVADRSYYLRVEFSTKYNQNTGGTEVYIYINDYPLRTVVWWGIQSAGTKVMVAWIGEGDRVRIAPKVNDGWVTFNSKTCYPLKGAK